jgi:ribosomal protein L16 Arg81 hydroxylase
MTLFPLNEVFKINQSAQVKVSLINHSKKHALKFDHINSPFGHSDLDKKPLPWHLSSNKLIRVDDCKKGTRIPGQLIGY